MTQIDTSGWRTIQSAPKNGEEVLVFSKSCGLAKARYHPLFSWEVVTVQTCCCDYYDDVTHWMRLPAPPQTGEEE